MPFTVFLLHAFVRTVPMELEESAYLDVAGTIRVFTAIVLPLLKSMLATLFMGIAPIVIFFLLMQHFIIRGVIAGSLKG